MLRAMPPSRSYCIILRAIYRTTILLRYPTLLYDIQQHNMSSSASPQLRRRRRHQRHRPRCQHSHQLPSLQPFFAAAFVGAIIIGVASCSRSWADETTLARIGVDIGAVHALAFSTSLTKFRSFSVIPCRNISRRRSSSTTSSIGTRTSWHKLNENCSSKSQRHHHHHRRTFFSWENSSPSTALSLSVLDEYDKDEVSGNGGGFTKQSSGSNSRISKNSDIDNDADDDDDNDSSISSWLQFPSLLPPPPTTTTTTPNTPLQLPIQLPTPSSSFRKDGRPQDITQSTFGPYLLPLADAVDNATGGWGLSYADLSPQTPTSPAGIAFLATNVLYGAVGVSLSMNGDVFYGTLTELAGLVSFAYHYAQLELGAGRGEVRLALLIDYLTAGSALIVGGIYMVQTGLEYLPSSVILSGLSAIVCLSLCWVWEYGLPYILFHSLWHVLSAWTAYLVGQVHIMGV